MKSDAFRVAPKFPARLILTTPVHLVAFGFGSGLARKAPGTWGTLLAVPLAAALVWLPLPLYLILLALLSLIGIWVCGESCRRLGVPDHPGVVFDEIVAYLLAALPLMPALGWWPWPLWTGLAAAFVLFRLFDIAKPGPIRWLDRNVEGGFGVMIDDLAAGLLAGLVLAGCAFAAVELMPPPAQAAAMNWARNVLALQ